MRWWWWVVIMMRIMMIWNRVVMMSSWWRWWWCWIKHFCRSCSLSTSTTSLRPFLFIWVSKKRLNSYRYYNWKCKTNNLLPLFGLEILNISFLKFIEKFLFTGLNQYQDLLLKSNKLKYLLWVLITIITWFMFHRDDSWSHLGVSKCKVSSVIPW